ncbi:helix-turn-helix domain-containing protein [uncultured Dokdonia sp.]|uniref:helix-turn-helix domain-containing protein n=1 Tax=uncultured Dokdonia sp. TaxID=575653 RepID=UPI00260E2374|nr:helix-turn-helix domain-containing protein [uncultured Dokdonia sp.]
MQVLKNTFRTVFILTLFFSLSSFGIFSSDDSNSDNPQITLQTEEEKLAALAYKNKSLEYLEDGNEGLAIENLEKYILATGDFTVLKNGAYDYIYDNPDFIALKDKYEVKFGVTSFIYLYVGLIGFFIAFVLNLRRKTDRVANGLIGLFVLMHSFFLIHTTLYVSNFTYTLPHTQNMSTFLSFMYGPVLYFYFKRITENYKFKKTDLIHLLPTLGFIIVFIPIYSLSAEEKLKVMMGVGQYEPHPYIWYITAIKIISLFVYGYFTFMLYRKNAKKSAKITPKKVRLQRTIMIIHSVYAVSYVLYAFIFIQENNFKDAASSLQFVAMSFLVLYIGYIAYANPQVLVGTVQTLKKKVVKYKNSGLTPSFSSELKEELVRLLEVEKVYRQNSIKLETIAERLGTTRHNASQVINEHFDLNFFELINKYRVEEAMDLLRSNKENLNIIDIAYEVGYNNKVTFNKSFKRFSNLTPSQFMKLERGVA